MHQLSSTRWCMFCFCEFHCLPTSVNKDVYIYIYIYIYICMYIIIVCRLFVLIVRLKGRTPRLRPYQSITSLGRPMWFVSLTDIALSCPLSHRWVNQCDLYHSQISLSVAHYHIAGSTNVICITHRYRSQLPIITSIATTTAQIDAIATVIINRKIRTNLGQSDVSSGRQQSSVNTKFTSSKYTHQSHVLTGSVQS